MIYNITECILMDRVNCDNFKCVYIYAVYTVEPLILSNLVLLLDQCSTKYQIVLKRI